MQTVGEILRLEREKKGLTIKDIESGTSIRALYLTAIEDGNYSIVPGEVYLKGFIRNYANFLGLDGAHMVELYRQGQKPPAPEFPSEEKLPDEPVCESKSKRDGRKAVPAWLPIGGAVLAAGILLWWFFGSTPQTPQVIPHQAVQEAKPAPAAPQSQPQPAQLASPAPQAKPVVVAAKFIDQCWTQITVDGKEVYEDIPPVGQTLKWEADRSIIMKLGNAAGVEVTYNGKPAGKLGGKGEVIVKSFSANTDKP